MGDWHENDLYDYYHEACAKHRREWAGKPIRKTKGKDSTGRHYVRIFIDDPVPPVAAPKDKVVRLHKEMMRALKKGQKVREGEKDA